VEKKGTRMNRLWYGALSVASAVIGTAVMQREARAQPADLLPDITVDENTLYDNVVSLAGGRTYIRLSNGTPNIGAGKLHLRGGDTNGDGTQDVWQRIFREDGSYWERLAGTFVSHPAHSHIHFDSWAAYRLRERVGDGYVGPIVAEGEKTSFCILDLKPYDTSLPGYVPGGEFHSCTSQTQGLSVGWLDIYSRDLEGQTIDITGIPDGEYWIESEVDPEGHVLESNAGNNIARIPIVLNSGATVSPDRYEPNESIASVKQRPVGGANSPNLGPVGPAGLLSELTVHKSGNADYFRFYSPGTGTNNSWAKIEFDQGKGDLDFRLLSDSGATLAQSTGHTGTETVGLLGRPRGWYNLLVYGYLGDTQVDYTLTIVPAMSTAPAISVTAPTVGDLHLQHGADTLKVEWIASDADGDPTWVAVYLCPTHALDGTETVIPTSVNTPGDTGFHFVNSAYVAPGTYWVYCSVTDGGAVTGGWSEGTVSFHDHCHSDFNGDGGVNGEDFDLYVEAFEAGDITADFDENTFVNGDDFDGFVVAFVAGC